jgi:uncharacterized OB-fold protein/acyl dehydratase
MAGPIFSMNATKAEAEARAEDEAMACDDELLVELKRFEGQPVGDPFKGPDAVNRAMIRHWVEAMGGENPVYVDDQIARENGLPGVIAPPTMLQSWIMRGYKATAETDAARKAAAAGDGDDGPAHAISLQDQLFRLLDAAGFTSVVATNCEQHYERPLVLGDHLTIRSIIESVSSRKATALGDGYFVTTRSDFDDQNGDLVATMRFRILRFRPQSTDKTPDEGAQNDGRLAPGAAAAAAVARRPRPAITHDNSFFFEGARQGKLLVQRCSSCGRLRHPPRPACTNCQSFDWKPAEASGRGVVYSYVVVHHPQVPGFEYPLPIAVVELTEGTRLVADLVDVDPDDVKIGMEVQCAFVKVDDELTLPMFRPVRGGD